jgi:integrase
MARKQKPYQTSWNEIVPGLARDVDARWRIVTGPHAGKRWSDFDERRAVGKAKQLLGLDNPTTAIEVRLGDLAANLPDDFDDLSPRQVDQLSDIFDAANAVEPDYEGTSETVPSAPIRLRIPDSILWPWLRQEIADRPVEFFRKAGLAEWATKAMFTPLPKKPITIQQVVDNYTQRSPSDRYRKNRVIGVFKFLVRETRATMLLELTVETLLKFREKVETSTTLRTGGSCKAIFGTIKSAIAFAARCGMDPVQIRTTLDCCKVLWTAKKESQVNPRPISRADFHKLLNASKGKHWNPYVILGLNLCMTLGELVALKWESFDLAARTFATIRNKTQDSRIPRAAVLWDESLAALKGIKRKGPYVFTSSHGTRFNRNTLNNNFRRFATKAGLPNITFSHIRDGAYTAAMRSAGCEKVGRVLAGHSAAGYEDNYVLRDPECVRPACDAVYLAYFGHSKPPERSNTNGIA